jgi:hypothetical protein
MCVAHADGHDRADWLGKCAGNHELVESVHSRGNLRLLCDAREKLPESRMASSCWRRSRLGEGSGGGKSLVSVVIGGSDCGIAEVLYEV